MGAVRSTREYFGSIFHNTNKLKKFGFLLIALFLKVNFAIAQIPLTDEMLGGTPRPELPKTQVAFIQGWFSTCSGILVGPQTILTAGHCAELNTPVWAYKIHVANMDLIPVLGFYNSLYDHAAPVNYGTNRYDLAVFQFLLPVPFIEPVPILFNAPMTPGSEMSVFGYGTNETTISDYGPFNNRARQGEVSVSDVQDGMFEFSNDSTGVSLCPGDSGGPALQLWGTQPVVVGINSFITNFVNENPCVVGPNSFSVDVDLQSSYSKAFLRQFPDIWFASPSLITFREKARQIADGMDSLATLRNFSNVRKNLGEYITQTQKLVALGNPTLRDKVKVVVANLRRAKSAKFRVGCFVRVRLVIGDLRYLADRAYSFN